MIKFTQEDANQLEALGAKLYHAIHERGLGCADGSGIGIAEDVMSQGIAALEEAGELYYDEEIILG